jgi:hypothetical protein
LTAQNKVGYYDVPENTNVYDVIYNGQGRRWWWGRVVLEHEGWQNEWTNEYFKLIFCAQQILNL